MREIEFELQSGFPRGDVTSQPMVIRLSVGLDFALDMLPYPTARRSLVTRAIFQQTLHFLGQAANQGNGVLLQDVRIAGQAVPEFRVYPSLAPSRLRVDGFLGLDFFQQFDVVEWHPRTNLLRLTIDD